jgi:Tol biopolymer transport system component
LMAYLVGRQVTVRRRVAFVDRKGVVVALPLPEDETYANPRVSPDGRQLVIERGNAEGTEVNLWIYDLAGSVAPRQLTYGSGSLSTAPEWTRDGERILFLHRTGDTETIMSQPADGSGPAEPVTAAQIPDMNSSVISLSPDGTNLLVRVGPTGQRADIWLLPLAGTEKPRAVIEGPGNKLRPRFSPDGNWIAYSSDESGRGEVYVQNFRTGARRRITTGGGFSTPDWSPDGRHLFYLNGTATSLFRLMSVEVRTQSGFEVLPPTTILEGVFSPGSQQPYSISREGRILIVQRADESATEEQSPEIRVTLNWTEELKRLVPSR